MSRIADDLRAELDMAEAKAWVALSKYKFQMFGYWAAVWVHLNRIGGFNQPNPWRSLVIAARGHLARTGADGRGVAAPLFEERP